MLEQNVAIHYVNKTNKYWMHFQTRDNILRSKDRNSRKSCKFRNLHVHWLTTNIPVIETPYPKLIRIVSSWWKISVLPNEKQFCSTSWSCKVTGCFAQRGTTAPGFGPRCQSMWAYPCIAFFAMALVVGVWLCCVCFACFVHVCFSKRTQVHARYK